MSFLSLTSCLVSALVMAPPSIGNAQGRSNQSVVNEIGGFSVVLVVGETQQSSGPGLAQELPSGARRALDDMREFLPYKHYRVLDAQWTSCCSPKPASMSTTVAGRLQGAIGVPGPNSSINLVSRVYGFSISAGVSHVNLPIRFVLSLDEPASSHLAGQQAEAARAMERERQDLQADIETMNAQLEEMRRRVEVGAIPPGELRPLMDRQASLKRKLADLDTQAGVPIGARPIIDSSFTMQAGETVVVGTSRLGGDKALIALVTAVRKNATSRED